MSDNVIFPTLQTRTGCYREVKDFLKVAQVDLRVATLSTATADSQAR